MASFDPLAPGSAATLVLVGTRVSGMMLIAPSFATTVVPRLVRVAIVVLLTVLLQPAVLPLVTDPQLTLSAVATEALVGFAIGLGAAVIVGAAEMAGDVMAVQIGLSGSAILDPVDTSAQLPVLGVLLRMFTIALLLTLDLHHVMLQAMADSFSTLVPGSAVDAAGGLRSMVAVGSALFAIGIRFAAPVIAVVLLATIALAILSRAAPQINLISVSFPVQIAIGLFVLSAALPAIGRTLQGWPSVYQDLLARTGDGFVATP
ncbi:MAG: flagellar biosynthetic protein FliR [Gemmatimonadaceae bacterium]|nr:flagellar biosynthetic protein FliR [Gemmatimonadaceae bacterium]